MPVSAPSARKGQLSAPLVGQQKLFERGPGRSLQAPPLIHRNKYRRLGASLRHHLRPLGQAGLKKLAKPRLGVLD